MGKSRKANKVMAVEPVPNNITINNFKYLESIVSTDTFKNYLMNSNLDIKSLSIAYLLFGYINNKYYEIDEISKFFSIPRENIIEGIEMIINNYKNKVNGISAKQLKKILH